MLASAETVASSTTTALYFDPLFDLPPLSKPSQPAFKKHKVLPHPRSDRPASTVTVMSNSRVPRRTLIDTATTSAIDGRPATPPILKNEARDIKPPGPDLPPTPPAHSRTSSSSHSILPSSPTYVESPVQSVAAISVRSVPRTPPHKSPPTPDVTPPQPERRPKAFRPIVTDRFPSKVTSDSRTESFKTARESPDCSDEDERLTPRQALASSRTSQSTVRRAVDPRQRKAQDVGLGLGLESDDNLTPRTKKEFFTFDGEWGSASEVEQEWDDNLERNVVVRKRRAQPQTKTNGQKKEEVIEDVTVTPTNATKALRSMPLQERLHARPSPSPQEFTSRGKSRTAPSTSEPSMSTDARRFSGMSSKSTVSTVVEAILVDSPPQRQKTLRHVRKQTALRDSSSEISASSSAATSLRQSERSKRSKAPTRQDGARSESLASSGTVNSIASRKARREVWKSGGIPVVVIPDRKASMKSARTPSLRSTSSHRSKRSNSLNSVPLSIHSRAKDLSPYFEKPSRRGRTMSESDGSIPGDQLTMDYPPIVPIRRSSLSAPTSRNTSRAGSRAGSLTAESLKAHDTFLEQDVKQPSPPPPPKVTVERVPPVEGMSNDSNQKHLQPAPSVESHRDVPSDHRSLVDHNGDPFFGKRLTAHNTPFSIASVETNGTHSAADIAEAMAVNIYPHQNKSVLMVHHMSRPVDPANVLQKEQSARTDGTMETAMIADNPQITASGPDGAPVTPPQPPYSMDDVDSPLRNPRAPPEPPAIALIPATPSGLTPTAEKEKMLGNYFEEAPKQQPSLVRRALSLRKGSDKPASGRPGFLARTLSLSRTIRRDTAENPALEKDDSAIIHQYPTADDLPPDETKLHPFWRPAYESDIDDDDEDYVYDMPDEVDQVYRYPPIDNRPSPPRRSLSERMKRTFAILPVEDDDHYTSSHQRSPERRTIKRTPSGNLRVMKHRDSDSYSSSLRWASSYSRDDESEGRPSTAPDRPNRRVWGVEKRVDERGRRLFPGWQDKLEQYRPQNLQRRLSEHRRQKRTEALRQKISGPREVRDGVGEVTKRRSYKGPSYQTPSQIGSAEDADAERAYRRRPESVRVDIMV